MTMHKADYELISAKANLGSKLSACAAEAKIRGCEILDHNNDACIDRTIDLEAPMTTWFQRRLMRQSRVTPKLKSSGGSLLDHRHDAAADRLVDVEAALKDSEKCLS